MNIFFTIDYELFLGGNTGTVRNCLIRPLNALTELLDKYQIKLTLFVDAAYLLRLEQLKNRHLDLQNDYDSIVWHLIHLSKCGHDIQLHFHPQWLYSDYDKMWKLDYLHYKMSDVPRDILNESFANSKKLLESIVEKEVIAFRAGGYSLETLKDFQRLFSVNNIKMDSSVLRYAYSDTKFQKYDYREVCSKTLYPFSASVVKEDLGGTLKELPISTIRLNSILYVLLKNKIKRCYSPKHIYGDGKSIGTSYNRCERIKMQWTKLMHPMVIAATMDGVMSGLLQRVYQSYRNEDNFVVIGHPKAFTDASLNNVADFLQKVNGEAIFDTISSLQIKNHL